MIEATSPAYEARVLGFAVEIVLREKGLRHGQLADKLGISRMTLNRYAGGKHEVPQRKSDYLMCRLAEVRNS